MTECKMMALQSQVTKMNVVIASEKNPLFTYFSNEYYRKALKFYKSIIFQSFKSLSLPVVTWRPFSFVVIYVKNVFSLANTVNIMK